MGNRHDALLGLMRERGITQKALAETIKMSTRALNAKLLGKAAFSDREIALVCVSCGIETNEIPHYFFNLNAKIN